eukprot:COSAG02_NODE_1568_length_11897_cov_632.076454_6_plen_211_part_00
MRRTSSLGALQELQKQEYAGAAEDALQVYLRAANELCRGSTWLQKKGCHGVATVVPVAAAAPSPPSSPSPPAPSSVRTPSSRAPLPTTPAGHPDWTGPFQPLRKTGCYSAIVAISRPLASQAGQNSVLSRVKTIVIYLVIREKKQRFRVIRGVHDIYQWLLHTPHDSNPACDLLFIVWGFDSFGRRRCSFVVPRFVQSVLENRTISACDV